MNNSTIGGTKRKVANALAMTGMIIIFIAYMFPFIMVVINSLKEKRDIITDPFSWLFTIKGLSFDNFVKAFTQMDFLNAFKNSLIVTVSATVLVTLLSSMLAYYIVRRNNIISKIAFALMVASMIIPFQAIMIPLVSIYGGTLNVLNHRITLIFMHTGFSMAMSVFMFHGFIKGNIPYRTVGTPTPQAPVWQEDDCTGCGTCINSCPTMSIRMTDDGEVLTEPSTCIKCCACVKSCPTGALTFDTPYTAMLHAKCSARREPELFL